MPISQATYERVALQDPDSYWELLRGELLTNERKRGMSFGHGLTLVDLVEQLQRQTDGSQHCVRTYEHRLRAPDGSNCIPDIDVCRRATLDRAWARVEQRHRLAVDDEPMQLVVEIWSPTSARKDRTTKLAIYRERRDAEIWLVHPVRRTVTAYRLQPDGRYNETRYGEADGPVPVLSLPNVTIDLAALFGPA